MSVKLYDDALMKKLQSWTKGTSITLLGPNDTQRLWEITADTNNDGPIKLPLISLKRPGGFSVLSNVKRPMSYNGAKLDANENKASQINMIAISLPYQLDIYTRYQTEADEYIRNLVFNIINYPKLDIQIPYNDEQRIHHSNVRMSSDISDNSDIPERLISGQFTRYTIQLEIDDAYLFDIRYRDVYSLEIVTEMSNNSISDDSKKIKLV